MKAIVASIMLTSTRRATPVRARSNKAARIPCAAVWPVTLSAMVGPVSRGSSGSRDWLYMPESPMAIESKHGRGEYGPSVPKPVIEQCTSDGFAS